MVAENRLLDFIPRSLQLNMSKNNNTHKPKPSRLELNPRPSNCKKKKRKQEEDAHTIEEDCCSRKTKKKKSKDYREISQEPNTNSAGFYELEDLIAEFLSSRRLSNTLSTFLLETQHEFTRKAQKVKLEDMYHYYCNQIYENPIKKNLEEGKVNRENSFDKSDVDAQMNEENRKKQNNKGKSKKNGNAHMANLFIKTSNGSSEAKTPASEIDFLRHEKSKYSGMEAMDDFGGHANRKNTEKANANLEPMIRVHQGNAKCPNTSNKQENVFDYAEPVVKLKKKKAASDEINVTDKDEQNGGKKSKKSKKETTLEKEVQPMKFHALHGEAKKGRTADLRQDLENTSNIKVSKKEKKKKKTKLADSSPGDDGELGDTGVEIIMSLRKSQATGLDTEKRESDIGSVEDQLKDPSASPNLRVLKEETRKSSQMALAYNHKKNKKEKKTLKKLQVTFSHGINGEAKRVKGSLSQDTGNAQSITPADKIFETNGFLIGESEALEKSSADTISQSRSMPGKEDGAIDPKEHISPKSKEDKQKNSETPTTASAFRRVRVEEVNFVDPMLGDNSYWAKDGAENGYGAKAQQVLGQVRGKGFRHEKTKKKRGSYTGGTIDLQSHSIKFSYSDNDE